MIRTTNPNDEFLFINSSNIKCFAPAKSRIYVLFSDDGNGKTQIQGRIDECRREPVPATENTPEVVGYYSQIEFVKTGVQIPGNDPDLFNKGHEAVIAKLAELNPTIEFETY